MSDMVERVARALCQCDEQDGAGPWDWHSEKGRESYRERARAAIEAMREPSDEMRRAAKIWPTAPDGYEQDVVMGNLDGVEIYRAMIDAAL